MSDIIRGTTSQIVLPIEGSVPDFVALYVTFNQLGKTIIEKTLEDIIIDTDGFGGITINLTQEDTLSFSDSSDVEVQIRGKTASGDVYASDVEKISIGRILKEGVI